MTETCKHWEGDTLDGWWICAKCYEKLGERPSRILKSGDDDYDPKALQSMAYAPVAKSAEGVTLSQFIGYMVSYLVLKSGGHMHRSEAVDLALDMLRDSGEVFGATDFSWDRGGAIDLMQEFMSYWDDESGEFSQ